MQCITGSSLSLPAYERVGARATLLDGAFHEAKYEKLRRRKSEGGAGKKRVSGEGNSCPARASVFCRAKRGTVQNHEFLIK